MTRTTSVPSGDGDDRAFVFGADLWRYQGEAAWFFVTLPHDVADDIEESAPPPSGRGFGSVRVEVTLGDTTWATSLFPDTKAASYVLPVKRAVRLAEGIDDGDRVRVLLRLIDDSRPGDPAP